MVDENRVACLGKSDGYQMPSQSISARPLPLDHPRRSVIISVKIKGDKYQMALWAHARCLRPISALGGPLKTAIGTCQTPISVMDARWPYGSISVVGVGRVGLGLAQEYASMGGGGVLSRTLRSLIPTLLVYIGNIAYCQWSWVRHDSYVLVRLYYEF